MVDSVGLQWIQVFEALGSTCVRAQTGISFGLFHLHPLIQVWVMGGMGMGYAVLLSWILTYSPPRIRLPWENLAGASPSSSLPRVIGAHRPFHHKMVATRGRTCYYSRFLWGSLVLPAGWKPYQQSFSASSPWWEDLKGPVMLQGTAVRWRESFPRPCRGVNTTEFTLWNKYKQGKNGTMFVFFPHLNKHNIWKKIRQTLILEDKSFLGNIKILWQIWSVCQSSQYKYLSEVFATPPDSRSEVWALTSTTGSHNISLNGTDVFTRVGLCQSWSHKVSSQINIRFSSRTSE